MVGKEIEIKIVLSPEEARSSQCICRTKGRKISCETERNTLFDKGSFLLRRGAVLRVRETEKGALLTLKKPLMQKALTRPVKAKQEWETTLKDPETVKTLLQEIGFRPCFIYEKRRTSFRYQGVLACFDRLPFGTFLELEGDETAIFEAKDTLNFRKKVSVTASYPDLYETLKKEARLEIRDATFSLSEAVQSTLANLTMALYQEGRFS